MIKLKSEVNKSAVMRELRKNAEFRYNGCYKSEIKIEAYIEGAEVLFNMLRLSKSDDKNN